MSHENKDNQPARQNSNKSTQTPRGPIIVGIGVIIVLVITIIIMINMLI